HFPCRAATAAQPPPEPAALTQPAAQGTVLIVEDEVDIGRLWEGLFASHRIPHVWARDGDEALTLFHRHRHDIRLLFTDVGLPGMSGWKLAQSLRELDPHLPILITSGAFQPNDRTASGLAEPLVCLSKPFFPSAVIQQVQRLTANQPLTVTAHHA
ncbi:MAG: response regulator, partial [Opitutaceae bacterium]